MTGNISTAYLIVFDIISSFSGRFSRLPLVKIEILQKNLSCILKHFIQANLVFPYESCEKKKEKNIIEVMGFVYMKEIYIEP